MQNETDALEASMNNFTKRTISGIVLVIIIYLVHHFSGMPLFVATLVLSSLMLYELYNGFKQTETSLNLYVLLFWNILIISTLYFANGRWIIPVILCCVFFVFIQLIAFSKESLKPAIIQLFLNLYISLFFGHLVLFNQSIYAWLIYLLSFGTDTFAYLTGSLIGKHKLIPKVSPGKTVEGAVGGIAGAVLLTYLFFVIAKIEFDYRFIIIAILASIISQIGDLTASQIKRYLGIKDYGKIIPGHGGILDRFDSVLMVTPFLFWMLHLAGRI